MADEAPPLACPCCRGLLREGHDLHCPRCGRTFPVVAGIPDLRVRSDRYLDLDTDRRKATDLAALHGLSFDELNEEYWRRTPEVPAGLAAGYAANAGAGERRGAALLDHLGTPLAGQLVLDVGCGTGGLLVAAARRGARAVGVDIALRWLVVARRRLEEADVAARLVAADGAALPFRSSSFDVVTSIETVEHAADQRGLVQGCLFAVRPGGRAYLLVANRFSLAPEPSVRLWGVGYLPRRWSTEYVRRRRGTRYQFFRAISPGELRALAGGHGDVAIGPAPLPPPTGSGSAARQGLETLYDRLRTWPLTRRRLTDVAPFLELCGFPARPTPGLLPHPATDPGKTGL